MRDKSQFYRTALVMDLGAINAKQVAKTFGYVLPLYNLLDWATNPNATEPISIVGHLITLSVSAVLLSLQ